MAKSKRAPALFEMLQQQGQAARGGMPAPRWWKGLGRQDASRPSAERKPAPPPHVSDVPPAGPAPVAAPAEAPAFSSPSEAPAESIVALTGEWRFGRYVRFTGGRFEVSLTPVGAVVAAGVLLLALLCCYQIGRRAGSHAVPAAGIAAAPGLEPGLDAAAVRRGEPDSSVLNVRTAESSSPEAPPVPARSVTAALAPRSAEKPASETAAEGAPPAARMRGLNYIVIERFHTRLPSVKSVEMARQHAEAAQKWLAEQQVPTAIYPMENGTGYELWTTQGFKMPDERAGLDELVAKIRHLGTLYAKQGYMFSVERRRYEPKNLQRPGK